MGEARSDRRRAYGIGLFTSILLLTIAASIEPGATCLECHPIDEPGAWIQAHGIARGLPHPISAQPSNLPSTIWAKHFTTRPADFWVALLTLITVIWIGLNSASRRSSGH